LRMIEHWKKFVRIYQKEIWLSANIRDSSPRGWLYATLRVLSISWTVFRETKAASRAAALSFSSLLGLAPLVAITVLVAGFVLGNKDPNLAARYVSEMITWVAPQVGQLSRLSHPQDAPPDSSATTIARATPASDGAVVPPTPPVSAPPELSIIPEVTVDPHLVDMVNSFIVGARSGSAGAFGFITLILIVLLLFKSVEDVFNEIWGVRSGRSLLMRVVYYWTILTLGAVLFFACVTLLTASAYISVFDKAISHLPFSQQVAAALQWSIPAFTFTLLVALLTAFYRVIPNTHVSWRAALMGALVVAALLMLNNIFAFLYVRRVLLTESLYGSVALPLVVMSGLYIFWLYLLIGGQISYAVQNVHFRNSQAAWGKLAESTRERLSLLVLLTICRRFQDCLPPISSSHLSTMMKVPAQILNECLNRLVDMKLITPVPASLTSGSSPEMNYQPARPLSKISLLEFKRLEDNLGEDTAGAPLDRLDPVLQHYEEALNRITEQNFFQKNLEELLADFPFDESRPPFAMAAPR
jgi:membrane protein